MVQKRIVAAALLAATWPFASFAQDAVKIGVVMGLSGPPAIVDFGESYLQGMKLALKDYSAAGKRKTAQEIVRGPDRRIQKRRRVGACNVDPLGVQFAHRFFHGR